MMRPTLHINTQVGAAPSPHSSSGRRYGRERKASAASARSASLFSGSGGGSTLVATTAATTPYPSSSLSAAAVGGGGGSGVGHQHDDALQRRRREAIGDGEEFLRDFVAYHFAEHADTIRVTSSPLTLDEIKLIGNEPDARLGVRACRKLFNAPVISDQVGSLLWAELRQGPELDHSHEHGPPDDVYCASESGSVSGDVSPEDAHDRRDRHSSERAFRKAWGMSYPGEACDDVECRRWQAWAGLNHKDGCPRAAAEKQQQAAAAAAARGNTNGSSSVPGSAVATAAPPTPITESPTPLSSTPEPKPAQLQQQPRSTRWRNKASRSRKLTIGPWGVWIQQLVRWVKDRDLQQEPGVASSSSSRACGCVN